MISFTLSLQRADVRGVHALGSCSKEAYPSAPRGRPVGTAIGIETAIEVGRDVGIGREISPGRPVANPRGREGMGRDGMGSDGIGREGIGKDGIGKDGIGREGRPGMEGSWGTGLATTTEARARRAANLVYML